MLNPGQISHDLTKSSQAKSNQNKKSLLALFLD